MNPGDGLAHTDAVLAAPNPRTGEPWSPDIAVDDAVRAGAEIGELTELHMANVPEPVRRAFYVTRVALGVLAAEVRRLHVLVEKSRTPTG